MDFNINEHETKRFSYHVSSYTWKFLDPPASLWRTISQHLWNLPYDYL